MQVFESISRNKQGKIRSVISAHLRYRKTHLPLYTEAQPDFSAYRHYFRLYGSKWLLQEVILAIYRVHGQADQLKQVIVALVDNALKYPPARSSVELALNTEQQTAILKVSDTGIGISSADLPHIFERFYRADHANLHESGGSGLGLAIAQSILQEHHGHIEVESTPQQRQYLLCLPALCGTNVILN